MNAKLKRKALSVLRNRLKEKTQAQVAKWLKCTQAYVSLIVNEKVNLSERIGERLLK